MTFEDRLAELGVDLSDVIAMIPTHNTADAIKACQEYYAEIIDRMETRIVNLTGELNYIKDAFRDCATCTVGSIPHSDKCDACDEDFRNYEFAGVPEDWVPDDG